MNLLRFPKLLISLVIVACLGVFAYMGFFVKTETTKLDPINIAFNTWIGYSSFYIAEEEGLFDKYGISVKTSIIDSLAEKNAAIIRGDLDGMGGTIDSAIISSFGNLDASIIMMFDRSNGTDGILVTDKITSVSGLVGKSIAVEEGFVGHFFLLYVLDKAGISPSSVKLVPMTTDQAGTAFLAGKVDVAVTWEPLLSNALKRKGSRILVSSAEVEPILADTLLMSKKFLRERPSDSSALVRALVEANELWISNPDKYLPLIAKRWGWSKKEIADTLTTVQIFGRNQQQVLFGKNSPGSLQGYLAKAEELWFRAGIIKNRIKSSTLIDSSNVRELF